MVSYYLPIHFMAVNAILKKIMGGGGGGGGGGGSHEFSAFWMIGVRKSLINQPFFIGSLPKSNQLVF